MVTCATSKTAKLSRLITLRAQLVGYDTNGNEVYEGDIIIDKRGGETTVDYRDNPDFIALRTLKETEC